MDNLNEKMKNFEFFLFIMLTFLISLLFFVIILSYESFGQVMLIYVLYSTSNLFTLIYFIIYSDNLSKKILFIVSFIMNYIFTFTITFFIQPSRSIIMRNWTFYIIFTFLLVNLKVFKRQNIINFIVVTASGGMSYRYNSLIEQIKSFNIYFEISFFYLIVIVTISSKIKKDLIDNDYNEIIQKAYSDLDKIRAFITKLPFPCFIIEGASPNIKVNYQAFLQLKQGSINENEVILNTEEQTNLQTPINETEKSIKFMKETKQIGIDKGLDQEDLYTIIMKSTVNYGSEFSVEDIGLFKNPYCSYEHYYLYRDSKDLRFVISINKNKENELKLEKEKSLLNLAKITHEFKTPIMTVSHLSKNLFNELRDYPEIKDIFNLTNYIVSLIHDINDLSKNETNEFIFHFEVIDLHNILKFCENILHTLLKNNEMKRANIQAFLEISQNVPRFIYSDEKRLKQILLNFISNSYKFTNNGKISIKASIMNDKIRLLIEDTGVGIDETRIKYLYDYKKNQKADQKGMNKDGAGLGLNITRILIKKLGGDINVSSEPFKSTKFWFDLPLIEINENQSENCNLLIKSKNEDTFSQKTRIKNYSGNLLFDIKDKPKESKKTKNSLFSKTKEELSVYKQSFVSYNCENELIEIYDTESKIQQDKSKCYNSDYYDYSGNNKKNCVFYLKFKNVIKLFKNSMQLKKKIIILVDDHNAMCDSTKKMIHQEISKENVKVIKASDGFELIYLLYLDNLYGKHIKLIFSDDNMNFLNGFESHQIIFKNQNIDKNYFKFILLTGFSSDFYQKKYKANKIEYLEKPLEKRILLDLLKHCELTDLKICHGDKIEK